MRKPPGISVQQPWLHFRETEGAPWWLVKAQTNVIIALALVTTALVIWMLSQRY